jgi:excisionase family DNA binding protein
MVGIATIPRREARMEGKTYTLEETARLLRISKDAARDAVRAGRIKAIKPGGKYLVLKDPLDRMLDGKAA